jgi:predicted nuclease of predicted toxin-antitoxin system
VSRRRVLLDENLPVQLRRWLPGVEAVTAEFMGWKGVRNGDLMRRARAAGFAVLVTADGPLAASPQVWSPLGCVHVTSNDVTALGKAAAQIEAACLAVTAGKMIMVQV